jgi:hypothetical protein
LGKVIIIKTLGIPQLIYSASLLHIPDGLIKKANKILFNFLWGSRDKIKRRVIINTIENGGLQMCDIETMFHALKASWIDRIKRMQSQTWAKVALHCLNKISKLDLLLQMSFETKKEMTCLNKLPSFYQEVLLGKNKSQDVTVISSKSELFNQMLWGKRQLTVTGMCLYSESFIKSCFIYVKDVIAQDGKILPSVYTNLINKKY